MIRKSTTHTKVRPWLAALLTVLLPGLGHLYCGRARRAISAFLAVFLIGHVALAVVVYVDAAPYNIIVPLLVLVASAIFAIRDAWRTARIEAPAFTPKWYSRWFLYVPAAIAVWVIISYLNPVYDWYKSYSVATGAMEDTIMIGDYILADLKAYDSEGPERNDLVVFLPPHESRTYLKRCVAGPGDMVEFRNTILYVNGIKADLPATVKYIDRSIGSRGANFGPFEVPEGHYFMLGDNVDDSFDSRFFGPVSRESVVGKVIRVYFSKTFSRIGIPVE